MCNIVERNINANFIEISATNYGFFMLAMPEPSFIIQPMGNISVTSSSPGAEVLLDDIYKGSAAPALTLTNVTHGIHTIECRLSGYVRSRLAIENEVDEFQRNRRIRDAQTDRRICQIRNDSQDKEDVEDIKLWMHWKKGKNEAKEGRNLEKKYLS